MVSTTRNKSCKILSCLDEIVFFYSEFFASGNHYWNVEAKKNFFAPIKNCFLDKWKIVFSICQIFQSVKTFFFRPVEKFFNLTNSSLRPVERDFLSSRTFLFRALLKLLKFRSGNSCLQKLIVRLVELIFSHFSDTLSSESCFPSSGNVFLKAHSKVWDNFWPFKKDKKCFLFHLKSSFRSQDI